MNKKYTEIEFHWGTIEDAVNKLLTHKEKGKLVCGEFNGTMLYSDTVTMDGAYKAIIDKSKAEFEKDQLKWREDIERRKKEHKESIPELTKLWSQKGRDVLTEDKWQRWDEIVPIRLNDLYEGMELGASLEIISGLNNNGTLDEAKDKIEGQGHSGASFGLVCAMVREFCDRGNEFVEYVR